MKRYVALLRGINVGGKNAIRMTDLKACFSKQGFEDVVTYIASGNVLFSTRDSGTRALVERIEAALTESFDYTASIVLRNHKQMRDVVTRAPEGFGDSPAKYRYDVIFLKPSLTPAAAMKKVTTKAGVDQAYAANGVLYFSRLISKATQSHLGKIISLPMYKEMTIRNWNTTTALLRLMNEEAT